MGFTVAAFGAEVQIEADYHNPPNIRPTPPTFLCVFSVFNFFRIYQIAFDGPYITWFTFL